MATLRSTLPFSPNCEDLEHSDGINQFVKFALLEHMRGTSMCGTLSFLPTGGGIRYLTGQESKKSLTRDQIVYGGSLYRNVFGILPRLFPEFCWLAPAFLPIPSQLARRVRILDAASVHQLRAKHQDDVEDSINMCVATEGEVGQYPGKMAAKPSPTNSCSASLAYMLHRAFPAKKSFGAEEPGCIKVRIHTRRLSFLLPGLGLPITQT